ncbi:hypothetical protein MJD09_20535 [bacterium]|nr:hypothetical protein [bacterium]
MADFVLLIRGGSRTEKDGLSGVQIEEQLMKWTRWITSLESKGVLKGGKPLEQESHVLDSNGLIAKKDLADPRELITEYLLLDVPNIDEAAKAARGCPVLKTGGQIEIRPVNQRMPLLLDKMRQLVTVPMN